MNFPRLLRIARRHGAAGLLAAVRERIGRPSATHAYADWIARYDTMDEARIVNLRHRVQALPDRPRLSVLMPVRNAPLAGLRNAIESVRRQAYEHWELCIADDASEAPHVRSLLEEVAAREERCKVTFLSERRHISAATNTALGLASGDFIVLLDHDDILPVHALYLVAETIGRHPDAQLIYSDEDKLDTDERRIEPHFKPDWNPLLLLGQNYVSHLGAFRTAAVREIGGFREGFEGAQDYDLVLRLSERTPPSAIVHIAQVLYHWRISAQSTASSAAVKGYAQTAALRAVREHLQRTGMMADVEPSGIATYARIRYRLPHPAPHVTIVPVGSAPREFDAAALRTATAYPAVDIIPPVAGDTVSINAAVRSICSDLVCLLDTGLEPLDPGWLAELVGHAIQPGAGAVGGKLLYRDGRVAHAGYCMGVDGVINQSLLGLMEDDPGPFGRAGLAHNVDAVSSACLVVQQAKFVDTGGLDETQPLGAAVELDFCRRLAALGTRPRWTPHAVLRWRGRCSIEP